MQPPLEVLIAVTYASAGLLMPLMYWPQIKACRTDATGLSAFSLSKSVTQLVLRAAMLPFVIAVGNALMTCIVSLDFAARVSELWVAVHSLRRQGWTWQDIRGRASPMQWLRGRREPVHSESAATFDDLDQSPDLSGASMVGATPAGEPE